MSASRSITCDDYVDSIGNPRLAFDMIVGATQRMLIYPAQDFTISQPVPDNVSEAYERLCSGGFASHLTAGFTNPNTSTVSLVHGWRMENVERPKMS